MGTGTAVTADGDDVVVTNVVVPCGSSMLVVISSGVGVDITMELYSKCQTDHLIHCRQVPYWSPQ